MSLYFYDRQIRRWITQIIAAFSHFEVQIGVDTSGSPTYLRVPVRYGDITRTAAAIIKDNSENKLNTVPLMTISITDLKYDRDRIQNPTHIDKLHIRERKFNNEIQEYSVYQGNAFTVERMMPTPYELSVNLDIWTSNTDQKLQLLEQILPLFNPDIELQNSDNFVDWSSLSLIRLENVSWSSRTIPMGTEDSIDIATLSFKLPIWLSLPAKVKKLGVIQTIIASIYDAQGKINEDVLDTANLLKNRIYVTPTGYNLLLLNGQATLVPTSGPLLRDGLNLEVNPNDPIEWQPLVNLYGQLINGNSQLRLRKDNPDTLSEIVGTVAYHPQDPYTLIFSVDIDTIPSNTLPPVDAIIDPTRSAPGIGLPSAVYGQRYLILNDINSGKLNDSSFDGADAWKNSSGIDFVAKSNDIIEFDGTNWIVSWASEITKIEYFTNLKTGIQYKWSNNKWQKSYEGEYPNGQWSLVL